jgi:hypothetical protein
VKKLAAAFIVVFALLVHLGAIALVIRDVRLWAAAAVILLLVIAHLLAKPLGAGWRLPVSRKTFSTGSAALLFTGMALVLTGFLIAHLCNSNVDLFQVCAYPRSADFICHKIGPVLLLLGVAGSLAARRLEPTSEI